jgi:hypothetical protein
MVKEDRMRKAFLRISLFLALAVFSQGDFLSAQVSTSRFKESSYYYFSYTIEKIYTHRLGFIVLYRKASNKLVYTYMPQEWFNTIGGKGEIIYLGSGPEWPSMAVYYKDGEFSHVRLRLRRVRTHETWGVVPFNVNVDERFKDLEEVKLEF